MTSADDEEHIRNLGRRIRTLEARLAEAEAHVRAHPCTCAGGRDSGDAAGMRVVDASAVRLGTAAANPSGPRRQISAASFEYGAVSRIGKRRRSSETRECGT